MPQGPIEVRYIGTKVAEKRYALSHTKLYKHIKRKDFRSVVDGRTRLIDVQSADKFFDNLPPEQLSR